MIGFLRGKLLRKQPPHLLIDVQGVGYEVEAPMSTFYDLPEAGAEVTLFTHLTIREDAHVLFGFGSEAARFAIEWKNEPLPLVYIFAVLGAALLLELLPYVEELWQGLRATKIRTAGRTAG